MEEALRGAISELVGDLTQEIRAKLEPLIPPQEPPTMVGIPHRVQANHLELTDADPCSDTEKPFRTENGSATLQPRGEFYESRARPAGADSPEGNG